MKDTLRVPTRLRPGGKTPVKSGGYIDRRSFAESSC
jgi:hypothetical protein